ncbi:uncharacterized protein [Parasteatoda tepidariorum]|uniref:uncharacterized protein n=1 Tax=Parasteatoda tepidariorum TaxID=114398 RepID=UPI0039BD0BC9
MPPNKRRNSEAHSETSDIFEQNPVPDVPELDFILDDDEVMSETSQIFDENPLSPTLIKSFDDHPDSPSVFTQFPLDFSETSQTFIFQKSFESNIACYRHNI